jgi:hypothetical protein
MWHYGAPLDKRWHTDIGQPTDTKNHLFSEHNNSEKLETNCWRCLKWTVLLAWHVKCAAAPQLCICQRKCQNKHPVGLLPFNTNNFYVYECVFCTVEMEILTVAYTDLCFKQPLTKCQQSNNNVQKDNHSHYSVSSRTASYKKKTTLTTVSSRTTSYKMTTTLTTVSAIAQHRTKSKPHSLQSAVAQHSTKWQPHSLQSAVAQHSTKIQPHSLQSAVAQHSTKDNPTHYSVSSRIISYKKKTTLNTVSSRTT